MLIKNHKLEGVDYKPARAIGGEITPELLVLHDTAGRLDKFNSMDYLRTHTGGVAAHFVVEYDGTITQLVPTNRRTGHAGKSNYHGRKGVNGFSIGIEIVNVGKMTRLNATTAQAWFEQKFDIEEHGIQEITTDAHGHGFWLPYQEAQIASVLNIGAACFECYGLKDVQPHWYISPGRKVDTNPLFPLGSVRSRILGRDESIEDQADATATKTHSPDSMVTIHVPGSSLNMRRWPSFNPNVIAAIPHGLDVPVLASGAFDGRKWLKVIFDGSEGWVLAKYTREDGAHH